MHVKIAVLLMMVWIANCDARIFSFVRASFSNSGSRFSSASVRTFPKITPKIEFPNRFSSVQLSKAPSGARFNGNQFPDTLHSRNLKPGSRSPGKQNSGDIPGILKTGDHPRITKPKDSTGVSKTRKRPDGENPGAPPPDFKPAKSSKPEDPPEVPKSASSRKKDKPSDEKKNFKEAAEDMVDILDFDLEYDDVMEGLTEKPLDADKRPLVRDNESSRKDTQEGNVGVDDKEDEINSDDLSNSRKDSDDSNKLVPEKEPNSEEEEPKLDQTSMYHLGQISAYMKQIERAIEKAFRQTVEDTVYGNGTMEVNTTSEEEVDVNGHKYHVQKSIVQAGDNDSSIFIEVVESDPEPERKKRSNWLAEEANKAKSTDP